MTPAETTRSPPPRLRWHGAIRRLEAVVDRLADRLRPAPRAVTIEAYLGHGSRREIIVRGRAVAGRLIPSATGAERLWRRLRRMIARFSTHDLAGVRIEIALGGQVIRCVTDDEGYYVARWKPITPPEPGRPIVDIAAVDGLPPDATVHGAGDAAVVMVGDDTARLVVSDIDDTILATGVGRRVRMVARTVTSSAWSRHQVDGMPQLLRELERGPSGNARNPCFYVSSSPWNLYGFLQAFLRRHGCPEGALFLTDYGVTDEFVVRPDHRRHKLAAIDEIRSTHARARLVLVGDTTEADAEIYARVAAVDRARIEAILLHDDGADPLARTRATDTLQATGVAWAIGNGAALRRAAAQLHLTCSDRSPTA